MKKNYNLQNTNYKRNRVFASRSRRQNFEQDAADRVNLFLVIGYGGERINAGFFVKGEIIPSTRIRIIEEPLLFRDIKRSLINLPKKFVKTWIFLLYKLIKPQNTRRNSCFAMPKRYSC